MRGQSSILASVLMIGVVIALSVVSYSFLTSQATSVHATSAQKAEKITIRPPQVLVVTSEKNEVTKKTTFCSILRADYNIPLSTVNLIIRGPEGVIYSGPAYSPDCGNVVPAGKTCKVCADAVARETGKYIVQVFVEETPAPTAAAERVKELPKFPDLRTTVVRVYGEQNIEGYDLFFGDVNRAFVVVRVCNQGEDNAYDVRLSVSSTTMELNTTSVSLGTILVGDCKDVAFEGNVLSMVFGATFTAEENVPDKNPSDNTASFTRKAWWFKYCGSCAECNAALYQAFDYDTNAIVMLSQDISTTDTCISLDYLWKEGSNWVIFDGNGHEMYTSSTSANLFTVKDVNDLTIRNVELNAPSTTALYLSPLYWQDVKLHDANVLRNYGIRIYALEQNIPFVLELNHIRLSSISFVDRPSAGYATYTKTFPAILAYETEFLDSSVFYAAYNLRSITVILPSNTGAAYFHSFRDVNIEGNITNSNHTYGGSVLIVYGSNVRFRGYVKGIGTRSHGVAFYYTSNGYVENAEVNVSGYGDRGVLCREDSTCYVIKAEINAFGTLSRGIELGHGGKYLHTSDSTFYGDETGLLIDGNTTISGAVTSKAEGYANLWLLDDANVQVMLTDENVTLCSDGVDIYVASGAELNVTCAGAGRLVYDELTANGVVNIPDACDCNCDGYCVGEYHG